MPIDNFKTQHVWQAIHSSLHGSLATTGGKIVPVTDLWKAIGEGVVETQEQFGPHVDLRQRKKRKGRPKASNAQVDALNWSFQRFLTSDLPQTTLLLREALAAKQHPDVFSLFSPRTAKGSEWLDFVTRSAARREVEVAKGIIERGGIEGYELLVSEAVDEPLWQDEPLKSLPFYPSTAWQWVCGSKLPIELTSARIVVADESIYDWKQVEGLLGIQKEANCPILLFCYRIDPIIAEELGRMWRSGTRIVPFSADAALVDDEVRVNILADTAWIAGTNLLSYISRRSLATFEPGNLKNWCSPLHPRVRIGSTDVRFPAFASREGCAFRAKQLLQRAEDEHESLAEILRSRARLINGIAVSAVLPKGWASPSGVDLCVSAYRAFMDGVVDLGLWRKECQIPLSEQSPFDVVPARHIFTAILQANAILSLQNASEVWIA